MNRFFVFALAALSLVAFAGGVCGQEEDPFATGNWTKWAKTKWKEVSERYVNDGYDASKRRYKMQFAFRNNSDAPVIITYRGWNDDGSHYDERAYAEAGEVIGPKGCVGRHSDTVPVQIIGVRRMKPHS